MMSEFELYKQMVKELIKSEISHYDTERSACIGFCKEFNKEISHSNQIDKCSNYIHCLKKLLDEIDEQLTLKPCPFCGSDNISIDDGLGTDETTVYNIKCEHCDATFDKWYSNLENCINAWNKRV